MDSGRTPETVGERHFSNEAFDLVRNRRPSLSFPSAFPRPEDLESLPVPADDCIRLYYDKRVSPVVPDASEKNPQHTVLFHETRPFNRSLQDAQLMAEGKVFECERTAGSNKGQQGGYHQGNHVRDGIMPSS